MRDWSSDVCSSDLTRNYIVQSVSRISETDWTKLEYTNDNRLTLITCVEDVPNQRLCVQAVEKR